MKYENLKMSIFCNKKNSFYENRDEYLEGKMFKV